MIKMYKTGDLLNDKDALLNYIIQDGAKIGVVVGMRGRDRNHPLIGWCLFPEVGGEIYTQTLNLENYVPFKEGMTQIEKEVRTKAGKAFLEELKKMPISPLFSEISDEVNYRAVELALLRANVNRDNFFVCSNLMYGQANSELKPSDNPKRPAQVDWGEDVITEGKTLTTIRRAIRAMEWRAWKYYKEEA